MSGAARKAGRVSDAQLMKERVDFTKKRDDELLPVAREIFARVAKRSLDLRMGDQWSEEEFKEYYDQVFTEDVVDLLIKYNIRFKEVRYVFSVLQQVFSLLSDCANITLEYRFNEALAKRFGLTDKDDVRILHITHTLAGNELTPGMATFRPGKELEAVDKSGDEKKK